MYHSLSLYISSLYVTILIFSLQALLRYTNTTQILHNINNCSLNFPSWKSWLHCPKWNHKQSKKRSIFDYSPRAIWLRAIVVGGHEGVTHATVMLMGVGMLANGIKAMLLTSFIGLVAGTLNLAIAQYVSVYTQYDIMTFQAKRNIRMGRGGNWGTVPSPTLVAVAYWTLEKISRLNE